MEKRAWWKRGMAGVWAIAVGTVLVHALTGWRYGFNRDELMVLEDARHLAWGYVQYPPLTPFFGCLALKLFGTSLVGFRFFAAVVQAIALVLAGAMAKGIAKTVASDKWRVSRNSERNIATSQVGQPLEEDIGALKLEIGDQRKDDPTPSADAEERVRHPAAKVSSQHRPCHGDWAAVVATGAGVPFCLGGGALMQYISFDYVCWVLVAYGMVRVLGKAAEQERNRETVERCNSEGPEANPTVGIRNVTQPSVSNGGAPWWVVVGVGIGLGMMAKWTMGFLALGVVVGVVATGARRFLSSGWLWLGVLLAVAVWAPNVWWQWQRGFPSLDFLRFLHTRDVAEGLTDWFLVGQLELTLLAFPLAVAGLWFYFFTEEGKGYRAIGWMYVVPLMLLVVLRGRDYYLAPAYPMLYAAGAVWIEKQWRVTSGEGQRDGNSKIAMRKSEKSIPIRSTKEAGWMGHSRWFAPERGKRMVKKAIAGALVIDTLVAGCVALPIMPVNSWWWRMAARVDVVLPEELGWEELTETVAQVRERLPEADRMKLGILARNYGEMGALNLYGERYGLPRAISPVNSSWERGYGNPAPETVITVGYSREFVEENFASCALVAHTGNRYGVSTEETKEDPDIFVCRGLRGSWKEFWKKVRLFA